MNFNIGNLKNFNMNTIIDSVKSKGTEAIGKVEALSNVVNDVKNNGVQAVAQGAIQKAMNLDEIKGVMDQMNGIGNMNPLEGMDMSMLDQLGDIENQDPEELLKKMGISFK